MQWFFFFLSLLFFLFCFKFMTHFIKQWLNILDCMCAECLWSSLSMSSGEVAKFSYWNCCWVYWLQPASVFKSLSSVTWHMVLCFLRIVWDFLKEQFFVRKFSFVGTLNETIYLFSWRRELYFLCVLVNQTSLQFFCALLLWKKSNNLSHSFLWETMVEIQAPIYTEQCPEW